MSVEIKYIGSTIARADTNITKTLKTAGKYCEADIEITNTQDGGINPTGSIDITENGTYDVTDKASAVVNVQISGDIGLLESATNLESAFNYAKVPNDVVINSPKVKSLSSTFADVEGGNVIDITVNNELTNVYSLVGNQSANNKSTIRKVIIRSKLSNVSTYDRFTRYANSLEEVDADIDFRSVSSGLRLAYFAYVTGSNSKELKMRFVPNTLMPLSLANNVFGRPFTNDTLVSIANVLKQGAGTIALTTNAKTKISTITGTVSQVTDDTGTYDLFTADIAGTTILSDFITQTKGWTIA